MRALKKILMLLALGGIVASCHPKRAPSRGCDCPGGHGMMNKKEAPQDQATVHSMPSQAPS